LITYYLNAKFQISLGQHLLDRAGAYLLREHQCVVSSSPHRSSLSLVVSRDMAIFGNSRYPAEMQVPSHLHRRQIGT
jgi:hypothetical protein